MEEKGRFGFPRPITVTNVEGIAGGESGIRTHGTLLTYTRFPSVRLKPLGHLSCRARRCLRELPRQIKSLSGILDKFFNKFGRFMAW